MFVSQWAPMEDCSEQETGSTVAEFSRRKIYFLMGIAVIAAAVAGLLFQNFRFCLGVLVGGALSFINFAWLDSSTRGVFNRSAEGLGTGWPALKYLLRYIVLGAVLAGVYITDALPIVAVIIGLSAFVAAAIAEALYNIFFRNDL